MFQSLLLLTVLAHLTPLPVQAPTAQVAPQRPVQRPADLPSGERWLRHFNEDLLPFWNVPEAWGTPRGDFPTFRGNDGKAVDWTKLPEELATAPGWIKANYGRD